jgi:hypothetical protein
MAEAYRGGSKTQYPGSATADVQPPRFAGQTRRVRMKKTVGGTSARRPPIHLSPALSRFVRPVRPSKRKRLKDKQSIPEAGRLPAFEALV